MPRKHVFQKGFAYFITTNTKDNIPIFETSHCCALRSDDFVSYRKDLEFLIYGYVIMPTHFHWIIHPSDKADVPLIMKKVKGHSSFKINKLLGRKGNLWQENYYDHGIRNRRDFEEKIKYIHKNPVEDNLVFRMKDYRYSSYRNYYLDDHDIIRIDIPVL